ncbi:hypothetical protein EJ357_02165 [Streptomyces cyaneochromogenes]|uniref:Uncharacterized protein n=1 Tax=Streptomyces cyaneochromogenes TaxID=2496836 RepID=A0A3S9LZM5_9ACTN|nr:DUF6336 family protein [Streptomyces cyaneochromogenes]AZQ32401.1 hypothetical protein EJ357_02165 [Streptomyces cyaneochromogenes]
MELDDDGVRLPRLRMRDVLARGVLFGLGAVVLVAVVALFVPRHSARLEFLAVTGGLSGAGALVFLLTGFAFWGACAGDVRRFRDWRTITGQPEALTVFAPFSLRVGALAAVLAPAAIGLYTVVDAAAYDSWLHSH